MTVRKDNLRTIKKKRALQEDIDEVKLEVLRLKKMWKGMSGKQGEIETVWDINIK